MAYPVSAKAIEIAHNLASNLLQRGSAGLLSTTYGSAVPVVESFGSTGLPLISFGLLTSTNKGALIRVGPYNWNLGTDILGNTAAIYTPTLIQIGIELAPNGVMELVANSSLFQAILSECANTGCRVEIWGSASGSTVTEANAFTSGTLETWFENFQYPMVAGV